MYFRTRRLPLKYTKEERLDMGRRIHESGLTNLQAAEMFGIGEETARRYRLLYEQSQGIERKPRERKATMNTSDLTIPGEPLSIPDDYASMTREELIEELMKSRIREARLKKGYLVKGVGADKEYILLDIKNIK